MLENVSVTAKKCFSALRTPYDVVLCTGSNDPQVLFTALHLAEYDGRCILTAKVR